MTATLRILGAGVAVAAMAGAAPVAAQYYPSHGGQNVVGQVVNQVLGGPYSGFGYNGYNNDTQWAVQQCAAAVEQRLSSGYGGNAGPYGGGHDAYGNHVGTYGAGGGRVLAITHADRHSRGRVKVKGVASSGMNAGYGGYGYSQPAGDLKFSCEVDYRGYISDLHLDRNNAPYGYRPY